MIEQHHLGVLRRGDGTDLIGFTAAHEEARVRTVAPPTDVCYRYGTSRARQLLELQDVFRVRGCADAEAHEYGPFTCAGSLEHF
jgi:hypothetical protein